MTSLPEMLEAAWARALPGREAAERIEDLPLLPATVERALHTKFGRHTPLQVAHSYVNSSYIIGPQWRCWGRPLAPPCS